MEELKVNDICVFDQDNLLKIASNQYNYCRIVRIEYHFLRNEYYIVFCDRDGNPTSTNEQKVSPSLLRKLNPNEVVVTRYPYDMPIVKSDEVMILAQMYDKVLHDPYISNQMSETEKITMAKLIAKLQLFSAVIHQY